MSRAWTENQLIPTTNALTAWSTQSIRTTRSSVVRTVATWTTQFSSTTWFPTTLQWWDSLTRELKSCRRLQSLKTTTMKVWKQLTNKRAQLNSRVTKSYLIWISLLHVKNQTLFNLARQTVNLVLKMFNKLRLQHHETRCSVLTSSVSMSGAMRSTPNRSLTDSKNKKLMSLRKPPIWKTTCLQRTTKSKSQTWKTLGTLNHNQQRLKKSKLRTVSSISTSRNHSKKSSQTTSHLNSTFSHKCLQHLPKNLWKRRKLLLMKGGATMMDLKSMICD